MADAVSEKDARPLRSTSSGQTKHAAQAFHNESRPVQTLAVQHDHRFTKQRALAGLLDLLSSKSANHFFPGVHFHERPELQQSHNRQQLTPITQRQMIRQADYSAGHGGSGGAGASAAAVAHHASHAIQPSNRPVVPIVSQPLSRPVELPPQYRPRKPRKQVNVACQPCRKRRSKVNSSRTASSRITLPIPAAMILRHQPY